MTGVAVGMRPDWGDAAGMRPDWGDAAGMRPDCASGRPGLAPSDGERVPAVGSRGLDLRWPAVGNGGGGLGPETGPLGPDDGTPPATLELGSGPFDTGAFAPESGPAASDPGSGGGPRFQEVGATGCCRVDPSEDETGISWPPDATSFDDGKRARTCWHTTQRDVPIAL